MSRHYHLLIAELFAKLGLTAIPSEDNSYSLEVDERFQVMIGLYEEQWLLLFCLLDQTLPPSANLFGEVWPAHIQGTLEGQSAVWSKQALSDLTVTELFLWLERFIDDIAQRLDQVRDAYDMPTASIQAFNGMRY
jgi:hypothetical protein